MFVIGSVFSCPRSALWLLEKFSIDLNVVAPNRRHFIFFKDSVYRAFRLTRAAINTLSRVNEELIINNPISFYDSLVDAVYRTNGYAGLIFASCTGFRDDKRHNRVSFRQ